MSALARRQHPWQQQRAGASPSSRVHIPRDGRLLLDKLQLNMKSAIAIASWPLASSHVEILSISVSSTASKVGSLVTGGSPFPPTPTALLRDSSAGPDRFLDLRERPCAMPRVAYCHSCARQWPVADPDHWDGTCPGCRAGFVELLEDGGAAQVRPKQRARGWTAPAMDRAERLGCVQGGPSSSRVSFQLPGGRGVVHIVGGGLAPPSNAARLISSR